MWCAMRPSCFEVFGGFCAHLTAINVVRRIKALSFATYASLRKSPLPATTPKVSLVVKISAPSLSAKILPLELSGGAGKSQNGVFRAYPDTKK